MSNGSSVPTLQGIAFELVSSTPGKPNHILSITLQQPVDDSFAFLVGTWRGDGPNAKIIGGSIAASPVRITCSWSNGMTDPMTGMTGMNVLVGYLVPASRRPGHPTGRLRLDGTVFVTDGTGALLQGKGPGQLSGDEIPPAL